MTANASPAVLCDLCAPAGKCMKRMALCVANGTAPSPAVLAPVDVARYTQGDGCIGGDESMRPSITGEWVTFADHSADLAAAREEVALLRNGARREELNFMAQLSELRQRAEAAEADALTERALQRAAKELPEGWEIRVTVENGAGYVDLLRDGDLFTEYDNGDFADHIADAIDAALQEPRNG